MTTVLVGGCFDLLHFGHTQFLSAAKQLGDTLIVALESDENVRRMKGPLRPIHTQLQRQSMLLALRAVDKVICLPPMTTDQEYRDFILREHPDVIAVTEHDPILEKKRLHANAIGANLVVIPKVATPSTSQLTKLLALE